MFVWALRTLNYNPENLFLFSKVIEKSSFNPLVFTSGRIEPECTRVNKRLAEKLVKNAGRHHMAAYYASVMTYFRTNLRFTLLRNTLAAIQGFGGK